MRAVPARFAVFAGYLLVSFLAIGLPALVQGGGRYLGSGFDPEPFVWSFAWWPHAILHGQNPFFTREVWAPYGVNTMWSTTVPGLSLAFAPLTLLIGPLLSYDVAVVVLPALAAWTAFLLCRYLTHSLWPSIAGGYLFGFSSYMLIEDAVGGHLNLAAVFLLPLVALVILRYLDGELGGRGVVVRLGPALAAQLVISTEVLFTLTLALAVALGLAFFAFAGRRPRLLSLAGPLAAAYVVAAVITAPFLYYTLSEVGHGAFYQPDFLVANLGNFLVPSKITAAGGTLFRSFSSRFGGADVYLGLPALIVVALFVKERRRSALPWFLVACLLVSVVAALGDTATFGGRKLMAMPWRLVQHLPLFDNVLTGRLVVYTMLIVAVIVALWTANRRPGVLRWLLPVLAVVAIAPNPVSGDFSTAYHVPAFFTDSAYRSCLDPGETLLVLPIRGGDSVLWEVADGFRFRMAGGELGPDIPPQFFASSLTPITGGGSLAAADAGSVRAFVAAMHVTSAVLDGADAANWSAAFDELATPQTVGGVVLYHFTPDPPACAAA